MLAWNNSLAYPITFGFVLFYFNINSFFQLATWYIFYPWKKMGIKISLSLFSLLSFPPLPSPPLLSSSLSSSLLPSSLLFLSISSFSCSPTHSSFLSTHFQFRACPPLIMRHLTLVLTLCFPIYFSVMFIRSSFCCLID